MTPLRSLICSDAGLIKRLSTKRPQCDLTSIQINYSHDECPDNYLRFENTRITLRPHLLPDIRINSGLWIIGIVTSLLLDLSSFAHALSLPISQICIVMPHGYVRVNWQPNVQLANEGTFPYGETLRVSDWILRRNACTKACQLEGKYFASWYFPIHIAYSSRLVFFLLSLFSDSGTCDKGSTTTNSLFGNIDTV